MTLIATAEAPITERQLKFLGYLIHSKNATVTERALDLASLTKNEASKHIGVLVKRGPRIDTPVAVAPAARLDLNVFLADMPKSKFAIYSFMFSGLDTDMNITGDLMFFEVSKGPHYGRLQMKRLVGAPGSYNRMYMSDKDITVVAGILANNEYFYARLYAEHFSVCGKCGADLTDPVSRQYMMGPTCRNSFHQEQLDKWEEYADRIRAGRRKYGYGA